MAKGQFTVDMFEALANDSVPLVTEKGRLLPLTHGEAMTLWGALDRVLGQQAPEPKDAECLRWVRDRLARLNQMAIERRS